MAATGFVVEMLFGALGIVPAQREVLVFTEGPSLNYTTVLNMFFLVLAAILVWRFLRTGGPAMLRMMNASEGGAVEVPAGRDATTSDRSRNRHGDSLASFIVNCTQLRLKDDLARHAVAGLGGEGVPRIRKRIDRADVWAKLSRVNHAS